MGNNIYIYIFFMGVKLSFYELLFLLQYFALTFCSQYIYIYIYILLS